MRNQEKTWETMRNHEKPGGQLGETMENQKKPKRNQANQEKTRRN